MNHFEWEEFKTYNITKEGYVLNRRGKSVRKLWSNDNVVVSLKSIDGKAKRVRLDKLIYQRYNGNIASTYELEHLDGNNFNCKLENLTIKEEK